MCSRSVIIRVIIVTKRSDDGLHWADVGNGVSCGRGQKGARASIIIAAGVNIISQWDVGARRRLVQYGGDTRVKLNIFSWCIEG